MGPTMIANVINRAGLIRAPIAVVQAHHAALRSSSHSSMKTENWFQLCVFGVTQKTRDSDFGRSPLVRCGKYVSLACTLDLAPVQVRDTFGVLLSRASKA